MQQVREGSYDLDANMALLKLYQFYPSHLQNDVSLSPKMKIYFIIYDLRLFFRFY